MTQSPDLALPHATHSAALDTGQLVAECPAVVLARLPGRLLLNPSRLAIRQGVLPVGALRRLVVVG
jgi:hypothetical protein